MIGGPTESFTAGILAFMKLMNAAFSGYWAICQHHSAKTYCSPGRMLMMATGKTGIGPKGPLGAEAALAWIHRRPNSSRLEPV
jgi:hypothetical protein